MLFKMPDDGEIWGSRQPRPSAVAKVTGTLDYGADLGLKLPENTLHLALVQAKVSHANIKGIETSAAEKMPGVFKVVTHKDIKGKNRITGLITFPTNKGDGWDRPILCDTKGHFSSVTPSPSSAPKRRAGPARPRKGQGDLKRCRPT